MNGAESLIRTLVSQGVELCLANPGTSEMHLVQALDAVPEMRSVLTLFEGVATGAADGYGRMAGRPASTLLHLGAGLANGVANLHNARRAGTPLINIVGEHARHHVAFDAPLTADIEATAEMASGWIRTTKQPTLAARDGLDALTATLAGDPFSSIATLVLPADCSWGEGEPVSVARIERQRHAASSAALESAERVLGADTLLLIDGTGLSEQGLLAAARIAAATGTRLMTPTFPARVESGPGLPAIERMPYFPEQIIELMKNVKHLILAGSEAPVSFFAYQNLPSDLVPQDCDVVRLAHRHDDTAGALEAIASSIAAPAVGDLSEKVETPEPTGKLSTRSVAQALAATIPDNAIVAVDSGGGGAAYPALQRAARHTWLNLTGGSIGQGGPVATGAALACPERPVFALLGDGGAGYTIQYLWTCARENLDVTTIIFSNSSYGILDTEYRRLGINEVGDIAASLFDLSRPNIDWCALATGYGVPSIRATTAEEMVAALKRAQEADGPMLVEAMV
ncbi:MAG: acetolactate synthase large subunit [Pseudomonadaceae bacterium]|nr:acetolactate synthase large subunit [Pseudomonadaceae bacterium]